jgi:hypothetical protein
MVNEALRESSFWIESIPVAAVRQKMYKLSTFNDDLYTYFQSVAKPPFATGLLCLFYLMASYLPSVLLTVLLGMCGLGKQKE